MTKTLAAVCGLSVLVLAALAYAANKLANPDLPAAEPVTRIVQLDQGWSDEDRARYHFTAQGTLLLPLAWLQALEGGFFTSKKLIDPENLAGLRELTDGIAPGQSWNETGLPIGWAVDTWPTPADPTGPKLAKVGFSCAACHTAQINYKGTAIRIDGGGSLHDAGALQAMLGKALVATNWLPWKHDRFVDSVATATGQPSTAVSADLDAAGRLALAALLRSVPNPQYEPEGFGRLDALQRIANTVFADDLRESANNRRGDGAVKYPYLWDIWRLDWVQYNASVRQPMTRNVGEALGVRAEANLVNGQTGVPVPEPARWDSSVHIKNLEWMEDTLQRLRAPRWPEDILGKLDQDLAKHGHDLFAQHCTGCHGIKVAQNHQPAEWVVTQVPVEKIGTSPNTAVNFIKNTYSGAKLGQGELHAADALRLVTEKIKERQYDLLGLTPEQQAQADGFGRPNLVVADRPVYKARPLVGIWATPPYLHNGSVPTLYDLLSPVRPARFVVGSREYNPREVGYRTEAFPGGQDFDTTQTGNSNQGHWFVDDDRPGRIGPVLSPDDRLALIEYLKSANYADYPCRDAETNAPLDGVICNRGASHE